MGCVIDAAAVTRRGIALAFAAAIVALGPGATAQSRVPHVPAAAMRAVLLPRPWTLAGTWVYRSYLNRPDVIVGNDPAKALALLFGEGIMTLQTPSAGHVTGTFDMGGGYVLDLSGTVTTTASRTFVHMKGPGRAGTPTAGWEYDYDGVLAERWPGGVGQIPAIVGSVFRAKPHGTSKAGLVASFIAVKQQ